MGVGLELATFAAVVIGIEHEPSLAYPLSSTMRTDGVPSTVLVATAIAPGSRTPPPPAASLYQAPNRRSGSGSTSSSRRGRAKSGTGKIYPRRATNGASSRSVHAKVPRFEGYPPAYWSRSGPLRVELAHIGPCHNPSARELGHRVDRRAGDACPDSTYEVLDRKASLGCGELSHVAVPGSRT